MRSQLVSTATEHISNRYLLVRLASQAARALHRPNERVEETLNEVFKFLAQPETTGDIATWSKQAAIADDQRRLLQASYS